jgi:hypothetical protein
MKTSVREKYPISESDGKELTVPRHGGNGSDTALRAIGGVSDWTQVRRPGELSDQILLDRTLKWLATLPPALRPVACGMNYPRIVNRIGDLWGHCEYTRLYLQSLLVDRRKGRKGFPPEVKRELEALQQYYFEHLSGLPAVLWNAVPVRTPRIPNEVFPFRVEPTEIEINPPRGYIE